MFSLLTILGFLPTPGKTDHLPQNWEINLDHHHADFTKYGDMLLTPQQAQRYNASAERLRGVSRKDSGYNRWENNVIPYRISPQYSPTQRTFIGRALLMFEKKSCFRFVERTNQVTAILLSKLFQEDYLFIVPLDGCYSYVGKVGGRQPMSLARDCLANYIIWHELLHVLGFEHEHQRPDRDEYIRVEYANVEPGMMVNFEKIADDEVDYVDKYDYNSIMHYDSHAFGRIDPKSGIRLATMFPLQTGVNIGDNYNFSPEDIRRLNRLGKCDEQGNLTTNEISTTENERFPQNCQDKLPKSCGKFKLRGHCNDPAYRNTAIKYCARTCSMCAAAAQVEKKEEADAKDQTCRDIIPDCRNYRNLCEDIQYIQLMHKNCALTCQHC